MIYVSKVCQKEKQYRAKQAKISYDPPKLKTEPSLTFTGSKELILRSFKKVPLVDPKIKKQRKKVESKKNRVKRKRVKKK